jgi:hypothetical protein
MLLAAFLPCSCTDLLGQRFTIDARESVSHEKARNLAGQEVKRRRLPLPSEWQAQVRDAFIDYEFRRSRAILTVTIYAVSDGKRKNLYEVNVNKQTGRIEDFLGVRRAVPISDH